MFKAVSQFNRLFLVAGSSAAVLVPAANRVASADCTLPDSCGGYTISYIEWDSCLCIRSYNFSAAAAGAIVCEDGFGTALDSATSAGASLDGGCVGAERTFVDITNNCDGGFDTACGFHALADVTFAVPGSNGMTRLTSAAVVQYCCVGNDTCRKGPVQAVTVKARAIARVSLNSMYCGEAPHTIHHGGSIPLPSISSSDGRGISLISSGDGNPSRAVWFIITSNGGSGQGVTESTGANGEPIGVIDFSYQFSGDVNVEVGNGQVITDSQLDADGNGRFNERDWYLIDMMLGSTLQADLDKYNLHIEGDLNQNGDLEDDQIIAQEDLDIIREMLDAGLGAGEFGDWDGDGVVDCDDHTAVPTTLSATIGDANYRVELDYDLDGDNDATDRSAFDALYPTADIVAPFGILDLADLTAFITAHANQDPIADRAPEYGVWDLADITAFVTAFNTPCP